ncbi:hypothetical protein [Actinoplanes sp. HUAS TT8]|uniref:hypothetical protein n=1 Tax=Actinoplanes sp. HUAS TT8 TaxID=3447453 RepID=UPI003F51FE40
MVVDGNASVQFAGTRWLLFRVISIDRKPTYDGWVWLQGYSVNSAGAAIERREIFVRHAALHFYRPLSIRSNSEGDT